MSIACRETASGCGLVTRQPPETLPMRFVVLLIATTGVISAAGVSRRRDRLAVDLDANILQLQDHLAAHVLVVIGGRDRKIAFLIARTEA